MTPAQKAEALIRRYFDACNNADAVAMAACFTEDAVHYFPPGLPNNPFRGARAIADMWVWCVKTLGSRWTIERVLVAPDGREAVIEWTHWKTGIDEVLRGDEWYIFNEDVTLIEEIRAYYAAPADKSVSVNQLKDFDYAGRGYHMAPPSPPPKLD
ncbi:MAG: ketosteroid isomerase [Salinisphaeraceae bacterium]|nr:ketosteroid isomerase [Salinisphaeraceae bacterium]